MKLTSEMDQVVESWERNLLQMDRRNSRLYFKSGRSAVRVITPNCLDIIESLEATTAGMSFEYLEQKTQGRRNFFLGSQPEVVQADEPDTVVEPTIRPGDIVAEPDSADLQRRLRNLMARAKHWDQEQGLSVLFLAIGFLDWVDQDGEDASAPLLLLPVSIDRASPRDPFIVEELDDDLEVNEVLSIKLDELIGRPLPPFNGQAIDNYLDQVRDHFDDRDDMTVREDLYLSVFSFSKLAMVRDLKRLREFGTDNIYVRTLAGDRDAAVQHTPDGLDQQLTENELVGGRLDDLISSEDSRAILDADFSQIIALYKARHGRSLVIHGPPGTGKSQTISNIIASLIGSGKKVLFVSEKTAALDVVKRRLVDQGLGVLCLDLHSDRGKKANVYSQLNESLLANTGNGRESLDLSDLVDLRDRLNLYTRLLHTPVQPLGITPFRAYGRLSELRQIASPDVNVASIEKCTQESRQHLLATAARMSGYESQYQTHETNVWRSLINLDSSLQFGDQLRRELEELRKSVAGVERDSTRMTDLLGLENPQAMGDAANLLNLGGHLSNIPDFSAKWIEDPDQAGLIEEASSQQSKSSTRLNLRASVTGTIDVDNSPIDWESESAEFQLARDNLKSIVQYLGDSWNKDLVNNFEFVRSRLSRLHECFVSIESITIETSKMLDVRESKTLSEIDDLRSIAAQIASLGNVPPEFLTEVELPALLENLVQARDLALDLETGEKELSRSWDLAAASELPGRIVSRYVEYGSKRFKWLSSGYREDHKTLQSCWSASGKPTWEQEVVLTNSLSHLRILTHEFDEIAIYLSEHATSRFDGRSTDWNSLISDIQTLIALKRDWSGGSQTLVRLTTSETAKSNLEDLQSKLVFQSELAEDLSRQLPGLESNQDQFVTLGVSEVQQQIAEILAVISSIKDANLRISAEIDFDHIDGVDLLELVADASQLRFEERALEDASTKLSERFGSTFHGPKTDWEDIGTSLTWVGDLLEMAGPISDFRPLKSICKSRKMNDELTGEMRGLGESLESYKASAKTIETNFDIDLLEWEDFLEADFSLLHEWTSELASDIDNVHSWIAYRQLCDQIDQLVGDGATAAIRSVVDKASEFDQAVDKNLIEAWVDWIHGENLALSEFSAFDHDNLRDRFRDLDKAVGRATARVIYSESISRYPKRSQQIQSGPLTLVRRELTKKRRRAPIRTLFGRAPQVIQALKPCVLMSPLAVSQYLALEEDGDSLTFDAVIFDEASQVFPEDAVPAMLRGEQIIFAGDQKQLPPTNFFRTGGNEEDYEEDDELSDDALEGMESILDVAVSETQLFDEAHLRVHYRSKDPTLIEFSNRYFYNENPLLTFPSTGKDNGYGIYDVFVENGIYLPGNASGARTNRIEAERVVDAVFDHFRQSPIDDSLGVVTFNRPQMDLITTLIDVRRRQEPDLEGRFSSETEEPFFVKNLENVQGDERDHIIISVTYGPVGESGEVPQRFGINRSGGERRLNVAVSRSRKRMTVVRSFHPSKISTNTAGPRLLKRFLEYVIDPEAFFDDTDADVTAETESPFEDSVLAALESRGHKVAKQIGTAGYRIDLAIRSETGTGFDLGIECDGATYHRAPAARDRDWQRQQILEDLGWNIHRIWSTSWLRNPERELEKIENALEIAKIGRLGNSDNYDLDDGAGMDLSDGLVGITTDAEKSPLIRVDKQEQNPVDALEFEEYEIAVVEKAEPWMELKSATRTAIYQHVREVAVLEGPVHIDLVIDRIRMAYGIGRVQGSTRDHVAYYIEQSIEEGLVRGAGGFIWAEESQLIRTPRKSSKESKRKTDQIPPSELVEGVERARSAMYGGSREELIKETARLFGITRAANVVRRHIGDVVDFLDKQAKEKRS